MKSSDTILWDKLRKGDKDAFNEIYAKYVKVLFNFGKRYTHNDELVEDCIQDLFTNLWMKRNSLGSTNQIKPYLLISIKRRILRQISKGKKITVIDYANEFYLELSVENQVIKEDDNAEIIDRLNGTLENLTPKQKEVIYLKFFEQLSYREIAQIMKVEVKAIYKLMARAIKSLKSNFNTLFLFI